MLGFSILIAAYNVSDYIEECLDSVKMQTYEKWEVIIVDDGSTDDTGIICDRYARQDKRITVIHQKNHGVAVARNYLLNKAKEDYIIFLDGDDFWRSERMLTELAYAIEANCADIVAWWLVTYDTYTGKIKENKNFIEEKAETQSGAEFMESILFKNPIAFNWWGCMYAFQRSLWINSGIMFTKGRKIREDVEVLFKVFLQAKRVWVIGKYYYSYRTNRENSATQKVSLDKLIDSLEVAERNISYLKKSCGMNERLKKVLESNFASIFMRVGTCLYELDEKEKKEFHKNLKDRRWMLKNISKCGTIKFRIKVMLVRILGVKTGFRLLWWREKKY